MTTILLQKRLSLSPDDFKTQLYLGLVKLGGIFVKPLCMLPRVEIEWGQPQILLPIREPGDYIGVEIYDRPEGGEALGSAQWWPDGPPITALPRDNILLNIIRWP
jgi:hypothetical protein